MMERENVSIRLSKHKREQIGSLVDRGYASNETDAHRKALNEGLRQYGVTVNGNGDTWLKRLAGELARAFAYLGVAWLGFFALFPIRFRLIGVAIMVMALALVAIRLVLGQVEPRVTHALQRGESEA